jgi:hypothetical protein
VTLFCNICHSKSLGLFESRLGPLRANWELTQILCPDGLLLQLQGTQLDTQHPKHVAAHAAAIVKAMQHTRTAACLLPYPDPAAHGLVCLHMDAASTLWVEQTCCKRQVLHAAVRSAHLTTCTVSCNHPTLERGTAPYHAQQHTSHTQHHCCASTELPITGDVEPQGLQYWALATRSAPVCFKQVAVVLLGALRRKAQLLQDLLACRVLDGSWQ